MTAIFIYTCTGLTSLGLSHNRIGDNGALALADCLRSNRSLQSLVLSHNEIGIKGAETLVASLTQNRTLKALYLASVGKHDCCFVLSSDMDDIFACGCVYGCAYVFAVCVCMQMQNNLQDSVCERCIEVLSRHNFSLRTIDLHNNSMSGKALRKVNAWKLYTML